MNPASEKKKRQFAHYLNQDEEMLYFTSVSYLYLFNKFIQHFVYSFSVFGGIGLAVYFYFRFDPSQVVSVITLLALVYAAQRFYFTKEGIQYILTNKRLIVQIGFFHITMHSANYNKITHVEVVQNLLERIFYKYGKIIVKTAGGGLKPIILNHINNPLEFRNVLDHLVAEEKSQFGHPVFNN